ncbi:MAG: helix-turn-helix transcriptional regulator [Porphyrobacter sp.]|nr:helix-turn-helix transcriptional regulator [Porphyrobacter sp.]
MRKRDYRQNCGVARAADIVGERWTLLIVRDLLIAPRRFSELERRMKGMGTNLLAKRLREMRESGLVSDGPSYALTEMGQALEPVVLTLAKWSLKWQVGPSNPDGLHFPDWDLLALKALFVPDRERLTPITACFTTDEWSGWVQVEASRCTFGVNDTPEPPDVTFACLIGELANPASVVARLPKKEQGTARDFIGAFRL